MAREAAAAAKAKKPADRAPTCRQWAKDLGSDYQWALDRLSDDDRRELDKALQAEHRVNRDAPDALKVQVFRGRLDRIIERTKLETEAPGS